MRSKATVGGVALLGIALLLGVLFMRGEEKKAVKKVAAKPAAAKTVREEGPAEPLKPMLPAESVAKDRETASEPLTAEDPAQWMKADLERALSQFSALHTYRFETSVRVYQGEDLALEMRSTGGVKDHKVVVAHAEVGDQKMEIVSTGEEARVRGEGEEEWAVASMEELGLGGAEAQGELLKQLAEGSGRSAPLREGPSEIVEGESCRGITMDLPDDETGGGTLTLFVDAGGNIKKWTLESELREGGEPIKTVVESRFSAFNAPFAESLPAWVAGK